MKFDLFEKTPYSSGMRSHEKNLTIQPLERTSAELQQAHHLYQTSFPDSERKPFEMVLDGQEQGKMAAYSVFYGKDYAGLAFVILGSKVDVLDYLAIEPVFRGHKIGSRILTWLNADRPHPVAVEIESTLSGSADDEAVRRKNFYLSNHLFDCHTPVSLFGVDMELLSSKRPISFDEYFQTMRAYFDDPQEKWISGKIFQKPVPSTENQA